MIEKQALKGKRQGVPIQERSFRIGDLAVINGYRIHLTALKARFAEGHYQMQETAHFLLFTRAEAPSTILVHWFAPDAVNADLGTYMMQELRSAGVVVDAQSFGQTFVAILGSLAPHDMQRAIRLYATNTLWHYRTLLAIKQPFPFPHSNMDAFATLYQRICQMPLGESLLDAGCLFGFLTLLVAESVPSLQRVVGADLQSDNFPVIRAIAEEQGLSQVQFVQADLLGDDVRMLEPFDTVVALAVIEHFTEMDMYRVLANLLHITIQRLVLAVPYEEEAEVIYEHKQVFTREKLEAVGEWCLQYWGKDARSWYEECEGGLLIIECCAEKQEEAGEDGKA